jgi:hypothetical protein
LISHPSGLARLEVRGADGRVDRYLLSGDELLGATDGRGVSRPRPLLQPYFLLQLDSEVTLRAALESFGIQSDSIGLAPCGEQDCFVIGDPRLAAPLPLPAPLPESGVLGDPLTDLEGANPEASEGQENDLLPEDAGFLELSGQAELSLGGGALGDGPLEDPVDGREESPEQSRAERPDGSVVTGQLPRLWVDIQQLQVRRIDRADGVFVVFGPVISFGRLKVPAWFEVHELGEAVPVRFEVVRAVQVNAPAKAFSRRWLVFQDLDDGPEAPKAPEAPADPN